MSLSRSVLPALLLPAGLAAIFLSSQTALSQKSSSQDASKDPPGKSTNLPGSDAMLKPKPRPKKPDLPASKLPLEVIQGERIALVGNSTAERFALFGNFETLLHLRYPGKELVVRNFARPADEVAIRQRSADYTRIDDPIYAFNPDTFLCFFGYNESFKGPGGVQKFEADYEKFLDDFTKKYPRDDKNSPPRFVLVSPIAFEETGEKFLPSGKKENANLKLYADAVKRVAEKRKLAFVDLYTPTEAAFSKEPGMQHTINGAHANEAGDKLIGEVLDKALFGDPAGKHIETAAYEKLRAAIVDKAWIAQQDYRMVNGWYVYGGRRTFDKETFPLEYIKLRNMAAVRDRYVWDIAQGKEVPAVPDDSKTGDLYEPPTRFGEPRQKYSENELGGPKILPPDDLIKTLTTPEGTEVKLFADESKFPELANPVQINFDNKGRLWVACMPSYPQWKPGDPRVSDKLVILEDTDGDGKADKSTVFYDKLHCPTGFEFWNGGVIVMDQPRILWLKDTNGDDKADVVVHLFDGWATDDTHHRGGFEWSPGGRLQLLEGIATSTTLETPWGPYRNAGGGGAYVIDPRSLKVHHFALPGMYNMWCYVFDEWGQGIVGDGTTANQTWDTALSGAQYPGRKGVSFILPNGVRPNLGSEWLVSRALPDAIQKQFTYACVIQLNGLTRYGIQDDGAGYKGTRLDPRPDPDNPKKTIYGDLVRSTDKHFRPADPQIGPDGALWFGDWANPLIGHMQYSQRDPNRDHKHGRIYRLVGKDKPLVKPVTQFGKSIPEILEQFREYEWRTRYRARRELRDRPTADVVAAVKEWVGKLDPKDPEFDRLQCEALWILEGHHANDLDLIGKVLAAKTPQARAAAVRVVADEREFLPTAAEILKKAATDEHPRVRAEAIRGLSFFPTPDAMEAVLVAFEKSPGDYWVKYLTECSLAANPGAWQGSFLKGELVKAHPQAKGLLEGILASSKAGAAAVPHLAVLLALEPQPAEARNKAMQALAGLKGNPDNGKQVFLRSCIACHKVGSDGADFGPKLDDVGKRLVKFKIVESIIDPNAEVDKKYLSTRIDTVDGKSISGLIVSEDAKQVVIFDGKEKKTIPVDDIEKRTTLKQSSMPEGQAGAMAPSEFLDLVEFLSRLKGK